MSSLPFIADRSFGALVVLAILFLSGGLTAYGQPQSNNTGTVKGKVYDSEDKPLKDHAITATNLGNKTVRSTSTNARGEYSFPFLLPGKYQIEAAGQPNEYPPVLIKVDLDVNQIQETILPDITMGRVHLSVQVLNSKNEQVTKVKVIAVNMTDNNKEEKPQAKGDGVYQYRYLRNGKYRLGSCACIGGQAYMTKSALDVPIRLSENLGNNDWGKKKYDLRLDRNSVGKCAALDDVCTVQAIVVAGAPAAATGGVGEGAPAAGEEPEATLGIGGVAENEIGSPMPAEGHTVERPAVAVSQANPPPGPQVDTGSTGVLLINTSNAARSSNFTERQIGALPLGGRAEMRTYDELAFLAPGVTPPPYTFGPHGPGVGFGVNTAGDFSVNGARARANNFTVDGSDNNDPDVGGRRQGFVALVPQPLESIKGFSISTLLWSAELGRNFGAQVNAVSKYGERGYHGQAYAFFTDESFNARNFFDYLGGNSEGKDKFNRTQAGLAVGGPLVRDRTHFFGSLERIATFASTEQHFSTPACAERRFLPERKAGERFGVLQYFNDLSPDANEFNTTLNDTPLGRNILSFYPQPDGYKPGISCQLQPENSRGPYGKNNYAQVLPADGDGTVLSAKVTQQFAPNYLLNVRYNFTDDERILPSINRAIRSSLTAQARTQNLSLIFDGQLTAKQFLQARFSYGRTRLGFAEQPDNKLIFSTSSSEKVDGIDKPFTSATGDIGQLIVEPFSPVGVDVFTIPQSRVNNTFQFAATVYRPAGAHAIRYGSEVLRFQFNSRQDRNYRPLVVYGNALLISGTLQNEIFTPDDPFSFTPDSNGERFIPGVQLAALGVAASSFQTILGDATGSDIKLRYTHYSFFVDDNWRLRPNFTLDYGLRYEYSTVPHEADGRIESALRLENLPAPGDSRFDTTARRNKFIAVRDAYKMALGGRTSIYDDDRNNFGPRLGFAWDPRSDGKMAVRAGYGIYYGAVLGAIVSQSRNIFPFEIPISVDPSFLGLNFSVFRLNTPEQLLVNGAPLIKPPQPDQPDQPRNQLGGERKDFSALLGELFLRNTLGGGLAFTLPKKNLPTPYAQQWQLTLEREVFSDCLISAAYVGSRGVKLTRLTTPNLGPNATPVIPVALFRKEAPFPEAPTRQLDYPTVAYTASLASKRSLQPCRPDRQPDQPCRPENGNLGAYQIFENSAASNYHALQLEARKRYSRGYTFTTAYTWSHAIDDVSDIFPIGGAPILPQSSDLKGERASASFDISHRFAASLVWDLPFYRERKGWKAEWFGGWQVASVFQAHTGQPFTLHVPFDVNGDGNRTDRPLTTRGLIFCDNAQTSLLCDGRYRRVALSSGVGINDFIPRKADGSVLQAQIATIGRNTLRGAGLVNLDLALNKKFRFAGERQLELRAESFNLFNRANFGLPVRTIGSPGFGAAIETVTPARIVQFALKFGF